VIFSSLVLDYQPLSQLPPLSLNYVTITCSLDKIKIDCGFEFIGLKDGESIDTDIEKNMHYQQFLIVQPIIGATLALI